MKLFTLLLCVAFIAGFTAVSGKSSSNNEQQTKGSAVKPTAAPLVTSTLAPTKAPKVTAAPTKAAAIKASAKPNNATKKTAVKPMPANAEKKMEVKATEKTPMAVEKEMMDMEVKPIDMPVTVATEKAGDAKEMATQMKPKEAKPLAVTGFITQNGNIYEIDDKAGIGKIEGRQSAPDDGKEHICNYGSVVVYSDVPCDEVVNVRVGAAQETFDMTEKKEDPKPQEETSVQDNEDKDDKEDEKEEMEMEEVKPTRRPNSKRPRNKNKRQKNKLRQQQKNRRNKNRRGNRRRQGQNQRRNQLEQESAQRKRRQQQKRRRAQQEDQGNRRQGQNQRRRNRGGNRRHSNDFEELDYNRGRFF